jgi:ferric iron reductase protein FhuF
VELEKKIEEMTSEMENHRLSIDDHNKVFYDMKKRKDLLQTERSGLWRNETLVQQNLASSKEELAKSDQVKQLLFCYNLFLLIHCLSEGTTLFGWQTYPERKRQCTPSFR